MDYRRTTRGITQLKEPSCTRVLSTREQIILLEASRLHGYRFPPWKTSPDPRDFEPSADHMIFTYVGKRRSAKRGAMDNVD